MDSIEFSLKKDSEGNEIVLSELSLDASKSLRQVLDALINIVEYEDNLELKIGVKSGSAVPLIIGNPAHLDIVHEKMLSASNGDIGRDRVYVNQMNVIYSNFKNLSDYQVVKKSGDNVQQDLNFIFESKCKIVRNHQNNSQLFKVKFINSHLELNGGKIPNFHLNDNLGNKITIKCSKNDAKKVNPFLYSDVFISTNVTIKNNKEHYQFIDIYAGSSESLFFEFKDFFNNLSNSNDIESFNLIFNKLEKYYDNKEFGIAKKFVRIFLSDNVDPKYLRTILLISKSFKHHSELGNIIMDVENLLIKLVGKVF